MYIFRLPSLWNWISGTKENLGNNSWNDHNMWDAEAGFFALCSNFRFKVQKK